MRQTNGNRKVAERANRWHMGMLGALRAVARAVGAMRPAGIDVAARGPRKNRPRCYALTTSATTGRSSSRWTYRIASRAAEALFWLFVLGAVYGLVVGLTH